MVHDMYIVPGTLQLCFFFFEALQRVRMQKPTEYKLGKNVFVVARCMHLPISVYRAVFKLHRDGQDRIQVGMPVISS